MAIIYFPRFHPAYNKPDTIAIFREDITLCQGVFHIKIAYHTVPYSTEKAVIKISHVKIKAADGMTIAIKIALEPHIIPPIMTYRHPRLRLAIAFNRAIRTERKPRIQVDVRSKGKIHALIA